MSGRWMRFLISLRAAASSGLGTVTRTISQPASSRRRIWATVASMSHVSGVVIDCTQIGLSPPTISLRKKEIEYPTTDGKVPETEVHRDMMIFSVHTLKDYYEHVPNVHVTGDLLLYYVEGDKRRHISPDIMVIKGVPKGERLYWLL